ncbi:MAG: NAD(P)/FAD-dependent oxidoreductase [Anaerolineae bacterium]
MAGKTVLILGGGVGGIVTANALRQRLNLEHRVVVMDKRAEYVFTPSLLWVMIGWRRPGQITKDLRRLLRPGVEVLKAEVQEIDPQRAVVRADGDELAYDYLVVALGADLAPEAMPGFNEAAHTPFDLEGAASLWSALGGFEGGRVAILVSAVPYKCPAAPYETALLLDNHFRRRGMRDRVEMVVYTPEPAPMGVAGPAMGRAVVGMLEARGIGFNPELNLTRIDAAGKELVFENPSTSSGQRREPAPFDFLVGVPPHRAPTVAREAGLANEAGWVPVDMRTLETKAERIYAIGDITTITLPNGKPLPKAGVFAHGQAEVVASNIAAEIEGGPRRDFDGLGYCWIEMGGGVAGFASGDFYAEPDPVVDLRQPGRMWHWGKVLFEKYWMGDGAVRAVGHLGLALGSKLLGIPASL